MPFSTDQLKIVLDSNVKPATQIDAIKVTGSPRKCKGNLKLNHIIGKRRFISAYEWTVVMNESYCTRAPYSSLKVLDYIVLLLHTCISVSEHL